MAIKEETLHKMCSLAGKMSEQQLLYLSNFMNARHDQLRRERANTMIFQIGEGDRVQLVHTMKRKYLRGLTGKVVKIETGKYPLSIEFDRPVGPKSITRIRVGYETIAKTWKEGDNT